MTYKVLKRQQLIRLRKERKFEDFVKCLKNADLNAFVDLRNLIFDREIGTNILTDLITGKDQDS
jgi:hypothetical protein